MAELGWCPKKIDSMALSDLGTVTHSPIDQMFYIDSLAMKLIMNESIAALSNFDRSDFHQLSKRFSFSFDPIDEETSPMFDLLLESNVRHENEENFFYSKKKRFV